MNNFISILLTVCLYPMASVSDDCDVVATVFEENICHSEITIKTYRNLNAEQLKKRELAILASVIKKIAIETLFDKKSFTPTQSEIDSYYAFSISADRKRLEWSKKISDILRELLRNHNYEDKYRKQLERAIELHEYTLTERQRDAEWDEAFLTDIEKRFGKDEAVKMKASMEETRRESPRRISEAVVSVWKRNKALFDRYGGRVIFQQMGLEPIDAYQALIEDIRKKGNLIIKKERYASPFADLEAYNKSEAHSFMSESKNYFQKPYWVDVDHDAYYLQAIEEYKKLPHN